MTHTQNPHFVFRRKGPLPPGKPLLPGDNPIAVNNNNYYYYLYRRGRQFSRLLAVEVCASAVVMLDTPCSEVV